MFDESDENILLDRMNQVKRLSRDDGSKLADLIKARDNTTAISEAKVRFNQLHGFGYRDHNRLSQGRFSRHHAWWCRQYASR